MEGAVVITTMVIVSCPAEDGEQDEEYFGCNHPQWDLLPKHARTWAENQLCDGNVLAAEEDENIDPGACPAYRISAEPQEHVAELYQEWPTGRWSLEVRMDYKDRYVEHTICPLKKSLTGTRDAVLAQVQRWLNEYAYTVGTWVDHDGEGIWEATLRLQENSVAT
jgi:hypothetical protein